MSVTLKRKVGTDWSYVIASYGQREEFEKALPGLIGPVENLISYKCFETGNGSDDFYTCIRISRALGDGTTLNMTYRVDGLQ